MQDSKALADLLHGKELRLYGDSAYPAQKAVMAELAPKARDFTNQRAYRGNSLTDAHRLKNRCTVTVPFARAVSLAVSAGKAKAVNKSAK